MGGLEVKFQGFVEIVESFFLSLALAGDNDLEALRDKPVSFAPHGRREWSLHAPILSQFTQIARPARCENTAK